MKAIFRYIYPLVPILFFISCTQYKNAFINRQYHNLTARYNVYFYANESLKEGIEKLEKAHKDDYSKILPMFIYGDNVTAKAIFPEMDRVIKKASLCIQRHAIKDKKSQMEIPNTGKWIDNSWNILGKARFYKREFFSGIEAFDYVASTYKSTDKYDAWLWIIKTYNELGTLSQSEPYITLIKNDKNFPKMYKDEFAALYAEFYLKQGLYEEAIKQLEVAIALSKRKKEKARFNFILGQLYEQKGQNEKAITYYKKAIKYKPVYDMVFYSKIKQSLLVKSKEQHEIVKKDLLKMTKDIKNEEFLDVIYFTLGQIEEKDKKTDQAVVYYRKSAINSKTNPNQKARAYLKLADIMFDKEDYTQSSAYFDSTVTIIKEDFPDYEKIINRKKSLGVLVGHIKTIKQEDSLQKVAGLDSASRNKLIRNIIAKTKENNQNKQNQQDPNNQNIIDNGNNPFTPGDNTNTGAWYFYNTNTKALGVNEFIKKWGANRKNEDNWRRSTKATFDVGTNTDDPNKDPKNNPNNNANNNRPEYEIDYYLKDLPLTAALIDSSNKKIIDAYYALGSIYREQLENDKRALDAFQTLNRRFPKNKHEPGSYYQMYRIYFKAKNEPKAKECKDFLLANYPETDYAKILNDPEYAKNANAKKSEVENSYLETFDLYSQKKYAEALTSCRANKFKYGKNDFSPKLAYIEAMCLGNLYGQDSLEYGLKLVTMKYNKSEVYKDARQMLDFIEKRKKTASGDTLKTKTVEFTFKPDAQYYCLFAANSKINLDQFKTQLSDVNIKYYSTANLEIMVLPKEEFTYLVVRTFAKKDEVNGYIGLIQTKPETFTNYKKEDFQIYPISTENMGVLLKSAKLEDYKTFYQENFSNLK